MSTFVPDSLSLKSESKNSSTDAGLLHPPALPIECVPRFTLQGIWKRLYNVSPFGSNLALTASTNAVLALVGLVTGPVCARLLGPEGRGELAALQNVYWLLAILAMLGMPEATLYFTAQDPAECKRISASALSLTLLLSPIFVAIAYPLVPVLLAAQSPAIIRAARLFILGIPLYALSMVPLFAFRGRQQLVRWNILRTLPNLGWLLLLLVIGMFFKANPRNVAFGYLAILLLAAIPALILLTKISADEFLPQPRRWPAMLRYGMPLAAAAVPFTLNVRLDQMIMAAVLPAKSLGIYVVAVSWSGAVPPVLVAIGTVVFPRVAGAPSSERATLVSQGMRLALAVGVVLTVVAAALTPFAVPLLFGRAFNSSIHVAVVLVFAALILGMNIVMEEGLRGLGETSTVLWGEGAGLIVTIGALAALLPRLGIIGAGIASILGYFSTSAVLLLGLRTSTLCSFKKLLILERSDLKLLSHKYYALRGLKKEKLWI